LKGIRYPSAIAKVLTQWTGERARAEGTPEYQLAVHLASSDHLVAPEQEGIAELVSAEGLRRLGCQAL
jgi:hypothetical protein